MVGACSTKGKEMKNGYSTVVGKPKAKRPLVRPRRRREDNIRMDTKMWTGFI
jgi:hypothetical protein